MNLTEPLTSRDCMLLLYLISSTTKRHCVHLYTATPKLVHRKAFPWQVRAYYRPQ
jgi:hypothetical protein